MKRLDNKGWSMTSMIALLCVLILFVLVVGILSWRSGISKSAPGTIYDDDLPDTTESVVNNN